MDKLRFLPFLFVVFLIISSCNNREEELKNLKLKEQEINNIKDSLSAIITEYKQYKVFYDSVKASTYNDTGLDAIPEYLSGNWSVRMVASESDCVENVIGDIRQERWKINHLDSTNLIVAYTNKNEFIRSYRASYKDSVLTLSYESPIPESLNQTIKITINDFRNNRMKGIRVNYQKDCTVTYNLELSKI